MLTPGLEVVGREKPVTVAYLDDLETSLVVSTSRAFHSVRRAESLVAQLKVPMTSPQSRIQHPLGGGIVPESEPQALWYRPAYLPISSMTTRSKA